MTYTGTPPELRLSLHFLLSLWKLSPEFINMLWAHRCYYNNKTIRFIKRSLSSQSAMWRGFLLWKYLGDVDSLGQPPLQQIMKTWAAENNMNPWTTCGSQPEPLSFWWNEEPALCIEAWSKLSWNYCPEKKPHKTGPSTSVWGWCCYLASPRHQLLLFLSRRLEPLSVCSAGHTHTAFGGSYSAHPPNVHNQTKHV